MRYTILLGTISILCCGHLVTCRYVDSSTKAYKGLKMKPPEGVHCRGLVPKITEGEYYFHDNNSYNLRLTTNVKLHIELGHQACFQVDIESQNDGDTDASENSQNTTTTESPTGKDEAAQKMQSLFYAVKYKRFVQEYPIRGRYRFGIPQFRSDCKCDCPSGENFCQPAFGSEPCTSPDANGQIGICQNIYHANIPSAGCANSGSASLCCTIYVIPWENARFMGIKLDQPIPAVEVTIEIFAYVNDDWAEFRKYERQILPYKGNYLHLNGYENVADMFIFAKATQALYSLQPRMYAYRLENFNLPQTNSRSLKNDSENKSLKLLEFSHLNDAMESDLNKFGALRLSQINLGKNSEITAEKWKIHNLHAKLQKHHIPKVTSCKRQQYLDAYDLDSHIYVLGNRSNTNFGASFEKFGNVLNLDNIYINSIEVSPNQMNPAALVVTHKASSAPVLTLDLALRQKINVVTHLHASYVQEFLVSINLDKHANRFINITLIGAYGAFLVQVYQNPPSRRAIDVMLSVSTNLPFAANYSEILPLPEHIASPRLVCIHPAKKPDQKICKLASYSAEPLEWFQVRHKFVESIGTCVGCNEELPDSELRGPQWILGNIFNPRAWFGNGASFSEIAGGVVEILLWFVVLVIMVTFVRKILYPLGKCAFGCRNTAQRKEEIHYHYNNGWEKPRDLKAKAIAM